MRWWCYHKRPLWGTCFRTLTYFVLYFFLLDWLKLNLNCWSVDIDNERWRKLRFVLMLIFLGFLRAGQSLWGLKNRSFLVALCCLIVRSPNLELATKRVFFISRWNYQGSFSAVECIIVCGLKAISCAGVPWVEYLHPGPWVLLFARNKFSVKVAKIISRIKVSRFDHIF